MTDRLAGGSAGPDGSWPACVVGSTGIRRQETKKKLKMESTRKLSNFNFQWTKTLYQNNLKNIAFFFTFFKG